MSAHEPAVAETAQRYFAAYNCDRDPFSDEGICGLFFAGGERGKIVDEILHACRFMRSPVFLSGRQGSGKTAVLHQFRQKAQSSMDVAVVSVELLQSEQQVLTGVLQAFGQPVASESSPLEQFVSWAGLQTSRQRNVVICFDNADHLNSDFLRPFFELVQHTEGYFTLVLAGAPDLEGDFESLSRRFDFVLNTIELPGFDEHQVQEYASYRLRAAGYKGDIPLTDIQVKAAQRRSNGNIAYLNELLRDMLMAARQGRQRLKLHFPRLHAALALVVLLIVLAIAARNQPVVEDPAEAAPPLRLESIQDAVPDVGDNAEEIMPDSVAAVSEPTAAASSTTEADRLPEEAIPEPANAVLAAEADGKSDVEPENIAQSDRAEPAIEPDTTPPASASSVSVSVATPPAKPERPEPAQAVQGQLSRWPDTGYALQVFGTHNAQRARQLVADFSAEADLLFYETLHNGKPWFVVIAGPFTGRQSAQASIGQLPGSLQRLRPWPRNIASIKGDIERYRLIQKNKLN